ncbi:MAG: hypothetical protein IT454_00940 [Planctomycetes bacterium]|nr:hypothetical protein [Planctomycetota bacterium]
MARTVDAQLRNLADELSAELVLLVRRAVLGSVAEALEGMLDTRSPGHPTERVTRRRAERRAPVAPTHTASAEWNGSAEPPLSIAAYEREVLLRALDEAGGDARRAGKLLGLPKSSIYRHLVQAGISSRSPEKPLGFANHLPLSQEAYEREVLSRALAATGDKRLAAKALGMGKSTYYRRAATLGVDGVRSVGSGPGIV